MPMWYVWKEQHEWMKRTTCQGAEIFWLPASEHSNHLKKITCSIIWLSRHFLIASILVSAVDQPTNSETPGNCAQGFILNNTATGQKQFQFSERNSSHLPIYKFVLKEQSQTKRVINYVCEYSPSSGGVTWYVSVSICSVWRVPASQREVAGTSSGQNTPVHSSEPRKRSYKVHCKPQIVLK